MIVRGQFSVLLKVSLAQAMADAYGLPTIYPSSQPGWPYRTEAQIEEEERMAIIHPDTHKAPIWRLPPERKEAPIRAYRVWKLVPFEGEMVLGSVAMSTVWLGPVIRSDLRPIDPTHWDKDRGVMSQVFNGAGIHAVKTLEQAKDELVRSYYAPVVGRVTLWGRVVQFTRGYRAELCMIKRLWLLQDMSYYDYPITQKVLDDLTRRYECDVSWTTLQEMKDA